MWNHFLTSELEASVGYLTAYYCYTHMLTHAQSTPTDAIPHSNLEAIHTQTHTCRRPCECRCVAIHTKAMLPMHTPTQFGSHTHTHIYIQYTHTDAHVYTVVVYLPCGRIPSASICLPKAWRPTTNCATLVLLHKARDAKKEAIHALGLRIFTTVFVKGIVRRYTSRAGVLPCTPCVLQITPCFTYIHTNIHVYTHSDTYYHTIICTYTNTYNHGHIRITHINTRTYIRTYLSRQSMQLVLTTPRCSQTMGPWG